MVSRIGCIRLLLSGLLLQGAWSAWAQDASPVERDELSAESELEALDPEALAPDEVEPGAALVPRSGIEEIVITSQGTVQPLQDVGVSVAAFDAEYMEALGAQNIQDIAQFTTNLEIRTVFSASNPTLFIRGVGLRDFNANSSSSVAVYNDDVYMNSPSGQLGQLFDIQQVEVLRGPQGTLYGRNASAGAIRVISRKPTGTMGGFTRLSYGRFDQLEVEGAVEMPIVSDLLSARISGRMNRRDGTTENRCASDDTWRTADVSRVRDFDWSVFAACFNSTTVLAEPFGQGWNAGIPGVTPAPQGVRDASNAVVPTDVEERVNDVDNWAMRGLLRWQPNLDVDWVLNAHGGRNRGQARQFQMIAAVEDPTDPGRLTLGRTDVDGYRDPDTILGLTGGRPNRAIVATTPEEGDPYAGDYNRTGLEELDLAGVNLAGDILGDHFRFRSITAWEWNERLVETNLDANPYIGLEVDFGNRAWQLSQELKTFWDAGGALTWQAGLSFLYEDLGVENKFRGGPRIASFQFVEQKTYAGSVYGFLTWAPSETLSIEGGMRWNLEYKTFDIATTASTGEPGLPPDLSKAFSGSSDVFADAPTGDISLNYKPTDDSIVYFKYSRGWKGPHFNGSVRGPGASDVVSLDELISAVAPEKVNALEFGFKTLLLDERLRLNSAIFYYDYEDIQIFQLRNSDGGFPIQELINANDADIYGVEFEAESTPLVGWTPDWLDGLNVFGSVGLLQSRYTDFVNVNLQFQDNLPVAFSEDLSGNTLVNAPRIAFAGYAQWDVPVGRLGSLTPRLDWSFKDKVFFSPQNLDEISQDALWLLNARIEYRTPSDRVSVAGWVRNLTDEVYRVDAINLARFRRALLYAMGDPRTYGITVSVDF